MVDFNLLLKKSRTSKARFFARKYGGLWKYYDGSWYCNDDKIIRRVKSCSCDDFCNHPPKYYLYENEKPTIEVDWSD